MAESLSIRFTGDRKKGVNYVGFARQNLDSMKNLMVLGELNTYSMKKCFDDGTEILLSSTYGINIINIYCPSISKITKKKVETTSVKLTDDIVAVLYASMSLFKLYLFKVTSSSLEEISSCEFSVSIPYADVALTQVIWDYKLECYQIFIGSSTLYGGKYCYRYAISETGELLGSYATDLTGLPSTSGNIEVIETEDENDPYNYYFPQASGFTLLDSDFDLMQIDEEYCIYTVSGYPTYSLPALSYTTQTLTNLIDQQVMVYVHGWTTTDSPPMAEWRMFLEDYETKEVQEFLISRTLQGSSYASPTTLYTTGVQVGDKLWYVFGTYVKGTPYYSYSLGYTRTIHIRMAEKDNPLNYSVIATYEDDTVGTGIFTHWVYSEVSGWSSVQTTYSAPTNRHYIGNMIYCEEAGIVLVSRLQWDNTDLEDFSDNQSRNSQVVTYPTTPTGLVTQYIDAYSNDGGFLYTTQIDQFTVPCLWQYDLHLSYYALADYIHITKATWNTYTRALSIGVSNKSKTYTGV